jgi:hypothetical protein
MGFIKAIFKQSKLFIKVICLVFVIYYFLYIRLKKEPKGSNPPYLATSPPRVLEKRVRRPFPVGEGNAVS